MKWTKFTLETTTAATDLLSYELNRIGVDGIEVEDHLLVFDEERAKKFGEIIPEGMADDGTAIIHFYIESPCDIQNITKQVKSIYNKISTYCSIGKGTVKTEETADIDWVNNWKQYFKPFRATENIVIKPTWENYMMQSDSDILIEIDPGTAFGTGSHETTLLCLQALQKYITPNMNFLDIGCGSGILTIAALKLGAGKATAVDVDGTAIEIAANNLTANKIKEQTVQLLTGNIIDDIHVKKQAGFGCYDMVAANILADTLIPLTSTIRPHMKKDGLYITSGIINTKETEVRRALLKNNFIILDSVAMNEWVSFVCKA